MSGPGQPLDPREWRRFFRSTLHDWRQYALLRAMDQPTFDKYSRESRDVQESLSLFSVTPKLAPRFLADVAPPFLRLLVRMYQLGDDITAFLLARNLGDLQEDRGLDAEAAWSLQFSARCARVMRFHGESLFLLERARRCALRAQADHPLLTEIYDLMGLVCHFTGRLDEADSHYRRSLQVLDRWPAAVLRHHTWRSKSRLQGMRLTNLLDLHLVKARHLSGTARTEEIAQARSLLAQICEASKGEPAVMGLNEANEGEILMVEGRFQEARTLLLRCIRRYDQDSLSAGHALPPMHRLLAQIASEEGNASEAYAHCREGLGLSLRYANSLEEGLIVEATLEIMGRFIRPRVTGTGVSALAPEDWKVIQNLVLLLESKDWYTGSSHSRGVSKLCRLLGSHLASQRPAGAGPALAADLVDEQTLGMAGLLHDIGKLRIPWSLLNKCNPLVPFEHRVLQSHVAEGANMLRLLGFENLARIVEEHHEKVDGSGYPTGRKELSLMGSVLAVGDSFEAMITPNRRYAHAKSREEAVLELQSLAGIHYDARVVAALTSLALPDLR